ncbi:hypothetical protein [Streptomyces sp. NPDC056468]|uniref:hypothetical protein n=1 Tax=Streptomyces sp. NPDC056468 TaxID=3345830 RepID=UPI0036942916
MRITLLTVPGCPNAPLARERIDQALDGRAAVVDMVEVADEAKAARLGMAGDEESSGTTAFALVGGGVLALVVAAVSAYVARRRRAGRGD